MIRSVDLTVWVILEVLKIIYAHRDAGAVKGKVRRYIGAEGFQVRRYAVTVVLQVRQYAGTEGL